MRKLFLILQVIAYTSLRLAAQEEVTVDCQDQWGPGRFNKVSVTIRFDHSGFARFTQDFPEGFTVVTDQSGGGDISWGGNMMHAVFMNVSQGQSVHFSYFIRPEAGMNGAFNIQSKLVVISSNSKRYTTVLKDRTVEATGTNGLVQAELASAEQLSDHPSPAGTNRGIIYRVQVSASSRPIPEQEIRKELKLDNEITISVVKSGKKYKYQAGEFTDLKSAEQLLKILRDNGLKDAFVVSVSGVKPK